MDGAKLMVIICCMLLAVCLTLCVTALTVLRHAIDENAVLQESIGSQLVELGACVEEIKQENTAPPSVSVNGGITETYEQFRLQIENGHICLRTESGALVRILKTDPSHLPISDREALVAGITVDGWEAAVRLMNDYEE